LNDSNLYLPKADRSGAMAVDNYENPEKECFPTGKPKMAPSLHQEGDDG
jgi:hypothetical protein